MPAARKASSSGSILWILLTPLMWLAFGLLHTVYHITLLILQAKDAIKRAIKRQANRPPASYLSLEDLLAAYECESSTIKVPQHLAVVLADTAPSSTRLYLSTLWLGLRRQDAAPAGDLWREFRIQYDEAVELKRIRDIAAIVHLARISNVQQLSVHASQPLSPIALQSLGRMLHVGYKTKAVFPREAPVQGPMANVDGGDAWSRYAELRRRTPRSVAKSSSSSSASSPGSPASSDSELGPPSLDETLASSYTAESDSPAQQDGFDATVNIRIGLGSASKAADSIPEQSDATVQDGQTPRPLQVTLLSRQDGQERLSEIVSEHIQDRASSYLSDVLVPDMASAASGAKRFSSSTLRKLWVSKRSPYTSELTADELDATLKKAAYLSEPELLVVFGGRPRARQLYGFPAWPLRVTDLFYDPRLRVNQAYSSTDFVAALRKLAKAEQRYGR
ncbi:Decaprenyl diphosphate synthase-like protein [Kalmanozyma brasiliensis GHG001]|uniref:Decaprenyl diphosphate synthase-like protein n=1 Tax=Kalmanozyma brasiliensis (strain GHG001) TaxID=1365824 RepID=UPI002868100F|nr:Decaprenyl diphosphate synthase-like protein [Kalmanozyma brasiliensis GHG001]KAF6766985.1 Decaprenyl diphosphate synthase-like protein [Kalmanozyma brasiliensis GHG001]